ncbi:hypothetical protein [Sphingomonas sp.]|uniref:hypothetical protein n=1 Tax=Sphingomonas sp. TaxID=28214 RepID=UPI003BAA3C2C
MATRSATWVPPRPRSRWGDTMLADPVDDPMAGLMPSVAEFSGTFALLIFYGVISNYGGAGVTVANYCGPAILSLVVGWAVVQMLRRNRHTLWTPLLWYRIGVVSYLGLGSLITLFLNDETRAMIATFFDFFPRDVLKFNMVVATFHAGVLVFTAGIVGPLRTRAATGNMLGFITPSNVSTQMIGFVFLAIGTGVNYLIIYPAVLGVMNFTPPQIIFQVGQCAYVGYFLVSYWALKEGRTRWIWLVAALTVVDSIAGLLQLSKYMVMFPALMLPIAYIYHRPSLRRIAIAVAFLLPTYFVIGDIVTDTRNEVSRGDGGPAVLSETVEALSARAGGEDRSRAGQPDYQISWSRLSYVNAGAFAISQYDQGLPGDSLRDLSIVWVPRLIYPDKPIITDLAREFTFLANGNYNSSTSPSIPAEAYWDFGWLGVGLFAALTAPVLALWSIYNVLALSREAWHLLVVVAMGLRVGSRIDGMLVIDIIGPISAAVVFHLILYFANRLLPPRVGA